MHVLTIVVDVCDVVVIILYKGKWRDVSTNDAIKPWTNAAGEDLISLTCERSGGIRTSFQISRWVHVYVCVPECM